jgi:t-SNARE complex subunit (syntaxin)
MAMTTVLTRTRLSLGRWFVLEFVVVVVVVVVVEVWVEVLILSFLTSL